MTPVSLRKRRLYTEEELDEARRVALRHAMEEANSLFAEERGKAEVRVSKAEGEKRALQDALNQFEATIGEMVARDNSNVSATVAALESDRSGLKAELLEGTLARGLPFRSGRGRVAARTLTFSLIRLTRQ